jgi:hypothetical protein
MSDGSVQVSGSRVALRRLAELIKAKEEVKAGLPIPGSDSPLGTWLGFVSIEPDDNFLLITTRGDSVVVAGDQRSRDLLAQNIEAFAGELYDPTGHMHIEYFPEHSYIRRGSAPLVIEPGAE